jgi:hypothetical protein
MFPLEELLIDFQELIRQHSGENMAAVVWSMLETYNIQDKVRLVSIPLSQLTYMPLDNCLMMDNASNNDTLMEALELKCQNAGIEFSASMACM